MRCKDKSCLITVDGFQRVANGAEAREGDLVMANPGGSAQLIYPGGCVTEIKPGTVITVNDGSKCPQPCFSPMTARTPPIPM